MKGCIAIMMTALMLLISGAIAQEEMRLYVQEGCMEAAQAGRLLALLEQEGAWALMQDERSLRELVLAGDAPDLAICRPQAARPWAKEGLLLALQTHIGSQQRMQRQVLAQCVQDEELFMAPLIAHHRQMAVNERLMEEMGLGYLLDQQAYPVWYPAQFYQILEEFLIRDAVAVDVWRADTDSSMAIEALIQSIYGGTLLSEDGKHCEADSPDMRAGVQWLCAAVDDGLIGYCQTQEDALERFLTGKTAIYLDGSPALAGRLEEEGLAISIRPYPAAMGLPVRSFELTGLCAFASGDAARDARLVQACAKLHEGAQDILGQRGIWQDGALWLSGLDADDAGATLRSLLCDALEQVMENGMRVEDELSRVQAAMDALERTP